MFLLVTWLYDAERKFQPGASISESAVTYPDFIHFTVQGLQLIPVLVEDGLPQLLLLKQHLHENYQITNCFQ